MVKLIIVIGVWAVIGVSFWAFKILKRKYLEPLFIGIMLFGIAALCQPLIFPLYSNGFAILLTGVAGYMFVSHMRA
jgi:hypothetical protein